MAAADGDVTLVVADPPHAISVTTVLSKADTPSLQTSGTKTCDMHILRQSSRGRTSPTSRGLRTSNDRAFEPRLGKRLPLSSTRLALGWLRSETSDRIG
jgi:hypothetical protein